MAKESQKANLEVSIMDEYSRYRKIVDCDIGWNTVIGDFVDLYRCRIGNYCKIHSFVYIEENVVIGDKCVVKPYCFLPTGVVIEDEVFIGPGVMFTNDRHPDVKGDWKLEKTLVRKGASIGAGAVIMCGVTIGEGAMVGSGAVVVDDVEAKATVVGNPARKIK